MEYTQWVMLNVSIKRANGLNPCCNGIYSMSRHLVKRKVGAVLILVVMEYTQWVDAAFAAFKKLVKS